MSKHKSTVGNVRVQGVRFTLLYRWHNLRPHALGKRLHLSPKTLREWEEGGRWLWADEIPFLAASFGCSDSWMRGECSELLQEAYRTLRDFWLMRSPGFDALADKLLKIDPPGSPEDFAEARRKWGLVQKP